MEVTTITGFGYLKDIYGNITNKCVLPIGKHHIRDGYDFIEVADESALNTVVVSVSVSETPIQVKENKIRAELRQMAIERLRTKGEVGF